MKIFANANIWKKLVIVFLAVLCLAFVAPKNVEAADDHIGGTLMKPICSFVVWFGDGVTNVLHKVLIKQDTTIITVDMNDTGTTGLKWLLITLGVLAVVVTGGIAAIGISAIAGAVGSVIAEGAVAGLIGSIICTTIAGRYICGGKRL